MGRDRNANTLVNNTETFFFFGTYFYFLSKEQAGRQMLASQPTGGVL